MASAHKQKKQRERSKAYTKTKNILRNNLPTRSVKGLSLHQVAKRQRRFIQLTDGNGKLPKTKKQTAPVQ